MTAGKPQNEAHDKLTKDGEPDMNEGAGAMFTLYDALWWAMMGQPGIAREILLVTQLK